MTSIILSDSGPLMTLSNASDLEEKVCGEQYTGE